MNCTSLLVDRPQDGASREGTHAMPRYPTLVVFAGLAPSPRSTHPVPKKPSTHAEGRRSHVGAVSIG